MTNLQYRQEKIQDKRKTTPWRDFVMEIASRYPVNLYKNNNRISRYPETHRITQLKNMINFDITPSDYVHNKSYTFFSNLVSLITITWYPYIYEFWENINSIFADSVRNSKNCYLSFSIINDCENICYTFNAKHHSKDIFNSVWVLSQSENVYSSSAIVNSYNIFFSRNIVDSNNIWSSSNMIWCSECISCNDLSNQSYCINNIKYDKDNYNIIKKDYLNKKLFVVKKWESSSQINTVNSWGDFLINCDSVNNWLRVTNLKNGNNCVLIGSLDLCEDFNDVFMAGMSKYFYGVVNSGRHSEYLYCCTDTINSNTLFYSLFCNSCSFCLGCIWLKNKSYCILNKQYTKEERYEKVDEIFWQMEKDWTLWEFFPASMNPFYFNDTAAYLIDSSFTKEEVTAKWYLWRDDPIKVDIPEGAEIVKVSELDQYEWFTEGNWTINPEILKKVIQDEQWNVRKIVRMEYDFLMKYGLPLPRKHWLDRMKENFRIR